MHSKWVFTLQNVKWVKSVGSKSEAFAFEKNKVRSNISEEEEAQLSKEKHLCEKSKMLSLTL